MFYLKEALETNYSIQQINLAENNLENKEKNLLY